MTPLSSKLQIGWVRHRRFSPKPHELRYPVFMWYLDLDEIDVVAKLSKLFSINRRNWLSYRRKDFFAPQSGDLKTAVIAKIAQHSQINAQSISKVRMLTNLRTLGFIMNPVTFYYAFDDQERLLAIMPEITNTPWNERFQYVLGTEHTQADYQPQSIIRGRYRYQLDKSFHISPFHPMNTQYDWRFSNPTQKTNFVHLENWQQGDKVFDATLSLQPIEITAKSIRKTLIRFPWMTVKVASGIYINALKLWLKGVPFYPHPNKSNKEKTL